MIGRIPFSFLHYLGKDGIVDSVIGVFSIVLIVSSVYFTFYFLKRIYNYKAVRAIFDCNGRRISYVFPILVLVPIFALLIFLFLYSDNFAIPKMTILFEIALLAPFYEEIGFRAILPIIANGDTNLTKIHAIIYSGMFAIMHIGEGNGLFYYLAIFTSSLYCYFLISITREVKYPIIFHALGNLARLFFIS
jgi:membrane protease YdiL (CAAX protease family)